VIHFLRTQILVFLLAARRCRPGFPLACLAAKFSRSARLLVGDSLLEDFLLRFLLLGSVVKTQLIYFTARQGSRPRIPTPSSFFCLQSVSVSFELSQDPNFSCVFARVAAPCSSISIFTLSVRSLLINE
jgi:hypothetical protein